MPFSPPIALLSLPRSARVSSCKSERVYGICQTEDTLFADPKTDPPSSPVTWGSLWRPTGNFYLLWNFEVRFVTPGPVAVDVISRRWNLQASLSAQESPRELVTQAHSPPLLEIRTHQTRAGVQGSTSEQAPGGCCTRWSVLPCASGKQLVIGTLDSWSRGPGIALLRWKEDNSFPPVLKMKSDSFSKESSSMIDTVHPYLTHRCVLYQAGRTTRCGPVPDSSGKERKLKRWGRTPMLFPEHSPFATPVLFFFKHPNQESPFLKSALIFPEVSLKTSKETNSLCGSLSYIQAPSHIRSHGLCSGAWVLLLKICRV